MLINPVTYATEGVRSALVGGNFLNSWLCIGVLLLFGFVMFFDSIRRFRSKLDLV
jgi:ABC-type polysaccharide/polyol phosphate export permease